MLESDEPKKRKLCALLALAGGVAAGREAGDGGGGPCYGAGNACRYPKPKGLSKKKRTFGEFILERLKSMEWRFARLVPPKPGQEAGESVPLQ